MLKPQDLGRSTMCRSVLQAALIALVGIGSPALSFGSYQHPAGQRVHAAATPIRASASHWKAQVGALKTYAHAGQVHASRTVGNHVVQSAPPKVTIESLLAQRALNPAKFDLAHKNLGRLLARDERLRAAGTSGPYNGLLYPSAYHNYLRWRWGLNPARFEHYHPVLGVILAEDNRLHNLVTSTNPGTITSPGAPAGETISPPGTSTDAPGGGAPSGGGGGGGPSVVPEPASFVLLALGGSVLGLCHAWRRRSELAIER
jgi:hypothetical protein